MERQIEQVESSGFFADLFAHGVGCRGIDPILRMVRKHLGMDVAFVSRFGSEERTFEHVDAEGRSPVRAGQSLSLEEGYCLKVVRGDLPELIPDTSLLPAARNLPETAAIPIGAHLSVPIQMEDGQIYGTLCCFSYLPDLTLGERDLKMLRAFAEVLANQFSEMREAARSHESKAAEIRRAMESGAPRIVCQPVFTLRSGEVTMLECLSRFDLDPRRTPDLWFGTAHEAGMGVELELHALAKALELLDRFPGTVSLAVNASPEVVISGRLNGLLDRVELSRVLLEITEHAAIADYLALGAALRPLRERGLQLAIDDVGAGYASMRHIVNLLPESIKLDMTLTRDIDTDPNRRALAKALIAFGRDIGASMVAEGVESEAELATLEDLGVERAQGYFLGPPMGVEEALAVPRRPGGAGLQARGRTLLS